MDITGLPALLLSQGPLGGIILYLIWERAGLVKALKESQDSRIADMQSLSTKVAEALSSSTEVMRNIHMVQDRNAENTRTLSEAVKGLEKFLERGRG